MCFVCHRRANIVVAQDSEGHCLWADEPRPVTYQAYHDLALFKGLGEGVKLFCGEFSEVKL